MDTTRAGHFVRGVPKEYLLERMSGQRRDGWKNPALEQLWRDIETITRSEALFSQDRFAAMRKIWRSHGM